jgi:diguanylate cyclase (GGDEF)-like protein
LALLIWSALRFKPWQTALGSLIVGLVLSILAGLGLAGFTVPTSMQDAVILLVFLSVIVMVPLFLAGAANQNRLTAQRLLRQARTDELTGLPNRSGFEAAAKALLKAQPDAKLALLYLDLDNFKLVNDNAGHGAGDELVRSLAGVLQAGLQSDAYLARLGGDEFAILLHEKSPGEATAAAHALRELIATFRFPYSGHVFSATASIGVVPFVAGAGDYSHLLAQADAACFTAKELGGNRIQVNSGSETAVVERASAMRWAVRLREGFDKDHFRIYCQSIVPLKAHQDHEQEQGRHFEVLIRLFDPDSGSLLMPGQFVPAAERFRMGPQLDQYVLGRTLRWLEENPAWLAQVDSCSINLCAASVEDEGFISFLHTRLAASSVPPHKLCFEITETSAVRDLGEAQNFIDGVRKLGCRLSLDDFGTGFCSFAYLDSLDVDYFKIDGSFVRKVNDSVLSLAIVRAIADIARSIDKKTIAEFVETPELQARLRELGVDYAQGYAIDKPIPIQEYFAATPAG